MTAADKPEFVRLRRQDKAVEDEAWIQALLERAPVGVLAMVAGGQPFLNINLFVYDPPAHALYFHTAGEGRTRTNIERDPRVCFCVSEMGRLLPADTALEFSVEYASVIVFGRVRILRLPDELGGEIVASGRDILEGESPVRLGRRRAGQRGVLRVRLDLRN